MRERIKRLKQTRRQYHNTGGLTPHIPHPDANHTCQWCKLPSRGWTDGRLWLSDCCGMPHLIQTDWPPALLEGRWGVTVGDNVSGTFGVAEVVAVFPKGDYVQLSYPTPDLDKSCKMSTTEVIVTAFETAWAPAGTGPAER